MKARILLLAATLLSFGPAHATPEVTFPFDGKHCRTTLVGTEVRQPAFPDAIRTRLEQDLAIAEATLRIAPDREDSHIWLGRRLSYLGRLCEAIDAFSAGIHKFPESYKLRRFRAQTLTRVREFERAAADFQDAARFDAASPTDSFEPDGAPNAQNLMLGTYRSNIYYYLAQTQFALGDWRGLVGNMERSLAAMPANLVPEHQIPTTFWRYLALRKAGAKDEAQALLAKLPDDIPVVEAQAYYQAVRMLRGTVPVAEGDSSRDPLLRFAAAMKRRFDGDETGARKRLRAIVDETANGYWPAEVELATRDRGGRR
jgi:tetratricopeptide (TPR) repeat protein